MSAAAETVDERLEWEARHRPRAAIAAFLGALLTLGGTIYASAGVSDTPRALLLDSLRTLAEPGPIGGRPSERAEQLQFFVDSSGSRLLAAILLGLGALAGSGALTYLAYATRARAERFARFLLYVPFVGGVLVLLASVVSAIGTSSYLDTLVDGPLTVDAIRDADRPAIAYAGSFMQLFGNLFVAMGYILVSLNAMRAGLLTRFLGVLGIIAGLLILLPIVAISPILQPLWLLMLGAVILGKTPGGLLPAWRTGRAEPWPTAREAANRRREAEERKQGITRDEPKTKPQPERVAAGRPHPSSKKRKRKRRD